MHYVIGVGLALAAGLFIWWSGLEKDRAVYPVILIVIAILYELFAVLGGSNAALLSELAPTAIFIGVSVLGFRTSLWWVVAGLIGHGLYDIFHPAIFMNPGVPVWWPMFCMAYDVAAGAFLARRLLRGRGPQVRFA
ncbi:hypothetical protein [Brevundimonas sp.]|uniref:hypothetical protein n=1 Tax=Brevundimonas sp. TaxID=1871086 RepID=UPI002D28FDA0|nr:hypothetical protein [Brevundimonas sp.]HYD26335.1 hypothetical protein [Brevundimonas sp.]